MLYYVMLYYIILCCIYYIILYYIILYTGYLYIIMCKIPLRINFRIYYLISLAI